EISALPIDLQTSLLRVLQENELIRLGGKELIPLNVRVVVATNIPLFKLIEKNQFRVDLYYRLNVLNLKIPPLRNRKEDIVYILNSLLQKNGIAKIEVESMLRKHEKLLLMSDWNGNIRELENFVKRFTSLYTISKNYMT